MSELAPMNPDSGRPELYRRRRQAVPHRRQRPFAGLLRPLLAALALVGTPVAAAWWAATTPYLTIAAIEVSGTERASAAWVREALSDLEGRHLLSIGLPDVRRRLVSHEWIRDISVRKELPDRLHVEVEERRPAAVLRLRGELWFVERDATVIARYDPRLADGELLTVVAPIGGRYQIAPALELAAGWQRLAPAWSGPITEIEIVSDEDFRVHTAQLEFPVLVSPEGLESGLDRLSWLLPELHRRYPAIASVDIRFSRQIVFQPAATPQTEEG